MKHSELALTDLTLTSPENWTDSCVIRGHLVAALRGQVDFRTADNLACIQEGRTAVKKQSAHRAEEALMATISGEAVQGAQ